MKHFILIFLLFASFGGAFGAESNSLTSSVYDRSAIFVVGVSDYSDGWSILPGVADDVDSLSDFFSLRNFSVEKFNDLTASSFKIKLSSFLRRYGKERKTRLIIYFAGHGHTIKKGDEREGFVVFKDAKDPDKDMKGFLSGSVPMKYFSDLSETIKAQHVMFVFDSCFAGSVFSGVRSAPEFIKSMLEKPVRHFFASGTEDQLVPDNSVFRRKFLDGIKGAADANSDSVVTGSELGQFVQAAVSEYSRGTQTPVFGKAVKTEGEMVFRLLDKREVRKAEAGERKKLIAIIKKNPHSQDAYDALARLREIDKSLQNLPPVTSPEHKDKVMKFTNKVVTKKNDYGFPYVMIGVVDVPWGGKRDLKANFRLEAKDRNQFKKLHMRRMMILSVIRNKMYESNLQMIDELPKIKERMRRAAKDGTDFACPGCVEKEPEIAGLSY